MQSANHSYDVITVGSATVDVFAHTDKSELIKILDAKHEEDLIAYPSGSKMLITELDFTTGGGGTNTAVAISRLGLRVAYLGKLGKDDNGDKILSMLKKEKIDFVGVRGREMTGYSIILDSIEHDRTILTYKGANNTLKYGEINLKKLNTKWFYFSSMVGESFKTLEKLALFAKKNNISVAFNPSSYLAEQGIYVLRNVLDAANIVVMNREEAELLVGRGNVEELLKRLKEFADIVIITEGKHGVHAYDGRYVYTAFPHKIKVVESTGAGDAFAASFLAARIKGYDIEFSLKVGLTNAESVIKHHGAKNLLLTWKKMLNLLKKKPVKVKKIKLVA